MSGHKPFLEETHLRMRMLTYRITLIAAVMSGSALFISSSAAQELPSGDGRDTVESACTACHGPDLIVSERHTQDEWRDIVSKMVGNGASMTDDQFATVVKYLSTTLAPNAKTGTTAHAAPPATTATVKH